MPEIEEDKVESSSINGNGRQSPLRYNDDADDGIASESPVDVSDDATQDKDSPSSNGFHVIEKAEIADSNNNSPQVAAWQAEFRSRVEEKDKREAEQLKLLEEQGSNELETWYKRYKEKLAKSQESARQNSDQAQYKSKEKSNGDAANVSKSKLAVEDREMWNRVYDLCDIQSRDKAKNNMARMRSILVSLKDPSD